MKRVPILIAVLLIGAVVLGFTTIKHQDPPGKYEKILHTIGAMLVNAHYSPQPVNDAFSQKVFKKYIHDLDPDNDVFLQSDIDVLNRDFGSTVDDEINGADVTFFKEAGKIFDQRIKEVQTMANDILSTPFEFKTDEYVSTDTEKDAAPKNMQEQKERWRKKLKLMCLDQYTSLLDAREKAKAGDTMKAKKDSDLLKVATDKTIKVNNRIFDRFINRFNEDDKFSLFANAVTTTMDPHTEFFPPVDKRYFDEEMSGKFYGIGALLVNDDGYVKISSVVAGTPAWKSGQIQAEDVILKVAEGNAEPVDLTGYTTTEAIKLIRGKKNTEVRLTLKKADGTIKVVPLVRDEIIKDETYARSGIIKEGNSKIGYIYLPEFYVSFDDPNGRRCYTDVAKEIVKLKAEQVDGIIMDLRYNGGGSLYDVVQMVGLFINDGPVVQVRSRGEKSNSTMRDNDKTALYTGPLAVMVNEYSASASEIFAAAIQDYGRGVIIGSTSTFGKGTVQRLIGLDAEKGFTLEPSDLGSIKITLQKFYRVNGGSTQLKGVNSDIVLPDVLEYSKVREKNDDDALSWDEIKKAPFTNYDPGYDLNSIKKLSTNRLAGDTTFQAIAKKSKWLYDENNKPAPLNLDKYLQRRKEVVAINKQLSSLLTAPKTLDIAHLKGEENMWPQDKAKQERFTSWLKNLNKDIYIGQTAKVIQDMVTQTNVAKTAQPKKGF